MVKKEYLAKINYNSRTGQASVYLKNKKCELLKKKKALHLKIREEDIF